MRFICVSCALVADDAAASCVKCGAAPSRPTPFDCARLGLLPELQELLRADPTFDVNAVEPSSQATLLHHAAINSKMRVLEFLAAEYRDSLDVDALGGIEVRSTPLFWAAFHNHIYAVELLLRIGADPSFTDDSGFCSFLLAIQRCFPILAAYLVAKGTSIDTRVRDADRRSALMLLSQRQRFHLDSFRMVLSLGADLNAQDASGNTALHHAVVNDLGLAVKMLLDKGASPLLTNDRGQTPLDVAREKLDERSMARHLLEEDAQLLWLSRATHINKKWLEDNVYRLSFLVPWLVMPTFVHIIVTTSGLPFILLKEAMLLTAAFALLKVLQRGSYGDKRKAAALMFGINVASVFWLVLCFPELAAAAGTGFVFQVSVYVSATLLLVFLFLTATTDAGTVFTTYEEKLHNIRTLVESKSPSATKLCLTCLHKRPVRAKHCAELNACIAKFDHFCPFVVNAVGALNHHYFVGFLFFAVAAITLELMACWWALSANGDVVWTQGILAWAWSTVHYEPLLVCVAVLGLIHNAWIGYLLVFHVYLLCAALTTNEVVKNENLSRAYSRGVVWNIVDFFGLCGAKRVDWKTLYRPEEFLTQASTVKTKHA